MRYRFLLVASCFAACTHYGTQRKQVDSAYEVEVKHAYSQYRRDYLKGTDLWRQAQAAQDAEYRELIKILKSYLKVHNDQLWVTHAVSAKLATCQTEDCYIQVYAEYFTVLSKRYPLASIKALLDAGHFVDKEFEALAAKSHTVAVKNRLAYVKQKWSKDKRDLKEQRQQLINTLVQIRDQRLARARTHKNRMHRRYDALDRQRRAQAIGRFANTLSVIGKSYQRAKYPQQQPPRTRQHPSLINQPKVYRSAQQECASDYGCGFGEACIKKTNWIMGVCAKVVNEYGNPTYSPPRPNSGSAPTYGSKQCRFSTDCPVGFSCLSEYGRCVKR